jgi:hypothetical protein
VWGKQAAGSDVQMVEAEIASLVNPDTDLTNADLCFTLNVFSVAAQLQACISKLLPAPRCVP